ncbi:hypothetical protein [Flavobacterium sp.]|uniref:hypothetical protein n=1 Tax=Flavobacterium sp. TaxID=239 RepID=UPI00120F123D|nr:hypothetical protein [Flavobacterium sp.]RZJ70130.1 MAG: hypothetical protein EOO49_14980 [Flavobacterium sp.]
MKTTYKLFFLLLFPYLVLANGIETGKHNKQKTISKAYKVNDDAGIDIDNQFGPVFVTTWDEDKIQIDVVIKVSGNSEDWVDKRLASIDVDINALTTLVSARTKIGNVSGKSSGTSMEIGYTIKIPKRGGVKVSNKYGDVISTDLFGPVKLNVQYGNLKLAKLNSSSNNFDLQYCGSVNIEKIKIGSIKADYSKLNIGSFENLVIKSDYTDVTAKEGNNVQYDGNYGKLKFSKVDNLEGKGDYLTVIASDVDGNISLRGNYSTIKVDNIGNPGGNVSVSGNYDTVLVKFAGDFAFDFEVKGKYTNVGLDGSLQVNTKIENNKERLYKGFHVRSGAKKIAIDGEYGNVSLKRN